MVRNRRTNVVTVPASPSSPSVRLTALEKATSTNMENGTAATTGSASGALSPMKGMTSVLAAGI